MCDIFVRFYMDMPCMCRKKSKSLFIFVYSQLNHCIHEKRLFSLFCLLGTVAGLFAGDTAYLFSYFINDSRDGLHLAYSLDGLTWTPLNHGNLS